MCSTSTHVQISVAKWGFLTPTIFHAPTKKTTHANARLQILSFTCASLETTYTPSIPKRDVDSHRFLYKSGLCFLFELAPPPGYAVVSNQNGVQLQLASWYSKANNSHGSINQSINQSTCLVPVNGIPKQINKLRYGESQDASSKRVTGCKMTCSR